MTRDQRPETGDQNGQAGRATSGIDERILLLAGRLWDYHQLGHRITTADAIVVLCSYDTVVAERGAELWVEGRAPLLVFSGGQGRITARLWTEPEAEIFARIARERGVPADRILIERRSTNTGENVRFTRQLLAAQGIVPQRVILVQKPYMERRSYATFRKVWPDTEVQVTSPRLSFPEYLERASNTALSRDEIISIMVGDLHRIRLYPEMGFQIPQEIPPDVWQAFEALVGAGFDRHLVR